MESIIVALVTGGLTLLGVIISNSKNQAVTETKLDELPEGNLSDYRWQDGGFVYEPLPEPEIPEEELATQARATRDKLLEETDWTQVLDAPVDEDTKSAYRAYRQALRDVPEQEGFPREIVWPELPTKVKADPEPVDEAVDLLLSGATGEEASAE